MYGCSFGNPFIFIIDRCFMYAMQKPLTGATCVDGATNISSGSALDGMVCVLLELNDTDDTRDW